MNLQELNDFLTLKAHEAEQGFTDSLDVYTMLHAVENIAKELKKELFDQCETDIKRYGKETPERNGFRIEVGSRRNWKFDDAEIDRLEALKKSRQELMKKAYSLTEKGGVMTDENGEVIPPATFTESQFLICKKL